MKMRILCLLLLSGLMPAAQVIVTPQLLRTGVLQKQQLWSMLVTNTGQSAVDGHLEVVLADIATGQPVLTGVGKAFTVAPGNMQINAALMEPIQYTQLSGNYVIEPGPNGFLPLGNFSVCISYFRHVHDAVDQLAEECDYIEIEPLSPPQLVLPWNEARETQTMPSFTWLPPAPASFFNNLRYDMDVVEVNAGQSGADAIQENIPLLHMAELVQTYLLYPTGSPPLQTGKQYAWRITATSNGAVVSRSEIWTFSLESESDLPRIKTNNLPYVKLVKDELPAYSLQVDYLKFDYLNETPDTAWNVRVYDLTSGSNDTISFRWDTLALKYGQNLVNIDLTSGNSLIHQHFYMLELRNSGNEIWRMRFEFRRNENENNP
ncbi:MAG: hypothetical protein KF862_16690 [Chitinophagaceae bacterium]|nr:hypothetical protein [Chitinophagaceae bacterium]